MRGDAESMPPVWPPVALTHPTLVARPFHHEGWIYEEKYDGWRLVAYKRDGQVWLLSRHHRDHTRRFPALAAAIAALAPPTLILDGEVVIFDRRGHSRRCRAPRIWAMCKTHIRLRPFAPDDPLNWRDSSPVGHSGELRSVKRERGEV